MNKLFLLLISLLASASAFAEPNTPDGTVPEPGVLPLMIAGLAVAYFVKRRK